ncbi:MAG: hypothetical protein ACREBJ_00630 [Nitrosotalea sp.]
MKTLHLSIFILLVISGSLYPAFALDTSQTCDTNILPPRWPSSHIYITDTNGSAPYVPLTDHTAIFHDDDVWNTSPYPKTVQVTLTIQYRYTGPQVFNQTQSLQMQACSGPESVKWRFVPIQFDSYNATVSDDRGKVDMSFDSMLDTTKSQTVSSPLEQLRFGVDSHNVICKQNLQLVIKTEDGSPACIKSTSIERFLKQGWINAYDNNGKYLPSVITLTHTMNITNTKLSTSYSITNATMLNVQADVNSLSLTVAIKTSGDGVLTMVIPKVLVKDPKMQQDLKLFVLVDGRESDYTQTLETSNDMTLSIPFSNGAEKIEVIGTKLI